jgi:hypothetical protein
VNQTAEQIKGALAASQTGKEMRETIKRLPGGIPDARLIPDDPNQGSFEDRNLYGG